MRRILSLVTLIALLFSSRALAQNPDLAVYRTTFVTTELQGDSSGTKKSSGYEIVDLASGDSVAINLRVTGTNKQFFTGAVLPHMLTTVIDSRGRTPKEYAVLADAFRGESQEVDSVQARVLKGKKVPVAIRGGTPTNVAKVMTGNQLAVFFEAALFNASIVFKLDLVLSKAVNDANETLAEAVTRVQARLVELGYQSGNP